MIYQQLTEGKRYQTPALLAQGCSPPTPEQLDEIIDIVGQGLKEGTLGVSINAGYAQIGLAAITGAHMHIALLPFMGPLTNIPRSTLS